MKFFPRTIVLRLSQKKMRMGWTFIIYRNANFYEILMGKLNEKSNCEARA